MLLWILQVGRDLREPDMYAGCVLIIESSEEIPTAIEVFRTLRNMGDHLRAVLTRAPFLSGPPLSLDP